MSECGRVCEVYSRACGYHRPITNWNKGKREEFKERAVYDEQTSMNHKTER